MKETRQTVIDERTYTLTVIKNKKGKIIYHKLKESKNGKRKLEVS